MSLPDGGKKWVEFDPTGLERAAKAVKELDSSSKSWDVHLSPPQVS